MKLLKALFATVVVLLLALVAIGLLLPNVVHVERSIATSAPPEAVYDVVSGFRRFNEWSPWAALDPATRYEYEGPDRGVGARMRWQSEHRDVGDGRQEIVAVEPGRSVTIRLDFGQDGANVTRIDLVPEGAGTRIVWSMHSDFGDNLVGRFLGPLLDRMVGPDFERGLENLKRLVEVAPPADAPPIARSESAERAPAAIHD